MALLFAAVVILFSAGCSHEVTGTVEYTGTVAWKLSSGGDAVSEITETEQFTGTVSSPYEIRGAQHLRNIRLEGMRGAYFALAGV